ncbi:MULTISPECIES: sugar ABC transporter substrate-binding protein [unclassified Saccharopolyspora]|uniref:ABC transporter substrate-binding protein n=1 Tax=unclassified Saccharopolyspora TaxID=2646250 RepID=UPI001CD3255D|nr:MULTISPECIES: sugar ABC transporter substrate-binding protein [unclassified Saccharopolyspora]MCA1187315.1 sugar ABC transporter substrate-binding protein [Saccharopolyspora sp. 6T]MCA1193631.1 sugar ABC transporter substrate-binding protein [Saccharopolyspora sp. 6V]MCA1227717.1 sugar ABC transporter substrate-binding protein [Saccharopolyspora sp. 6M]
MRDVPAISRRTALGAGAVLLAGAAGCAPARDPGEISLWNFYGPGGQNKSQSDWISRLAAEWNATHEVRVRLRYVPNKDYKAGPTLQTSFSAGAGPDVFLLSPGDFLRYYNGGALADLTPHLEPGVREDFLPEVLATRLVDDRVYGLPMEIEPLALFYSEDAFERAGLAEGDLPGTWDELLGLAERLTTPDRFGMLFETNPGYYQNFTWYPWLWMAGGDVFTPDLRRSAFDSPAAHRAMRLWQDAVRSGAAPRRVRGEGGNDTISNLAQGYCAMQQLGIWGIAEIAEQAPGFRYGVTPMPAPPGGTATTALGSWAMVANAYGANPEAAAEFVAWALGSSDPAGVERMRQWNTVAKTGIPPRRSVRRAAEAQGAFDDGPMRVFADQVMAQARPEPRYPPEVYRAISDALQSCQLDGADPAEAAGAASEQIDTFLAGYDGAAIQ